MYQYLGRIEFMRGLDISVCKTITQKMSKIPKATPLAPGDIRDIIDRRKDKAAAKSLAADYKISESRVRKIWQDAGIRFDKDAEPIYPDSYGAGAPDSSVRSSSDGKYMAKEPPEPVEADESVGDDLTADEAVNPDNIANEDEDKVRAELGTMGAGNDSDEVLEDVEERLSKLKIKGQIKPSQYRKLIREAESTHESNVEDEDDEGNTNPSPPETKRRAAPLKLKNTRDFDDAEPDTDTDEPHHGVPPRQVRIPRHAARPAGNGRDDRPGRLAPARAVQAPAANARQRAPADKRGGGAHAAPSRQPHRATRFAEPGPSDDGETDVEYGDGRGDARPDLSQALTRSW
jgi:hypothetical protein